MAGRTLHNLINAAMLGFSGNELHQYMDRAAKTLRKNHRDIGHDVIALIEMLLLFKHKYSAKEIRDAFLIHKLVDGMFSGIQDGIRRKNKGYGKKESIESMFEKLKKELTRV